MPNGSERIQKLRSRRTTWIHRDDNTQRTVYVIYISSLWIWKGVSATLQSGKYTLSYPRRRCVSNISTPFSHSHAFHYEMYMYIISAYIALNGVWHEWQFLGVLFACVVCVRKQKRCSLSMLYGICTTCLMDKLRAFRRTPLCEHLIHWTCDVFPHTTLKGTQAYYILVLPLLLHMYDKCMRCEIPSSLILKWSCLFCELALFCRRIYVKRLSFKGLHRRYI